MRCYLDDQLTPLPRGLDALQLRKSRHRAYWGFTYRAMGFVEGTGGLTFTDQAAVDYLNRAYARRGILTVTRFRLEDDDAGVLYDGFINYEQKNSAPGAFSFALRDDQATARFESQATTVYAVDATETIRLQGRPLDGVAALGLNAAGAVVRVARPNARPMQHSLPLAGTDAKEQPVAGTILGVQDPLGVAPFYSNTTSAPISLRLVGSVSLTTQASGGGLATLRLVSSSGTAAVVGNVSLANAVSAVQTLLVDATVTVPAAGSLSLVMGTAYDLSSYTLSYTGASLNLARVELAPDSVAAGLPVQTAFARLVEQMTGGAMRVSVAGLSDLFVTDGLNLRGITGPLKLSLRGLFDGLNAIYNLRLDVQGDTIVIEPKVNLFSRGKITYLPTITALSEKPNMELLFSEVEVGYQAGTGDGLLSALEPHTGRRYQTAQTTLRNTLNLKSGLIASGSLIEQQRRKQFDSATSSAAKAEGYDSTPFLIQSTGTGSSRTAAGLTGVRRAEGIPQPDRAYNLRITPRRNLGRWGWLLRTLGPLTLTDSDLRQVVTTRLPGEASALVENESTIDFGPDHVADLWQVRAPMSLGDYRNLGDWVVLADGRQGLLMDAQWRQGKDGAMVDLALWSLPAPSDDLARRSLAPVLGQPLPRPLATPSFR